MKPNPLREKLKQKRENRSCFFESKLLDLPFESKHLKKKT